MNKVFKISFITLVLLLSLLVKGQSSQVRADWWNRDQAPRPVFDRDERPVLDRGGGEVVEEPPVGGPPEEPIEPPQDEDGGNDEDACEEGKSFTGPYCGWSPSQDDPGDDGDGGIGGAEVLGLSDTSSGNLSPSDIIGLTGLLCLLLYTKSKLGLKAV